MKKGHDLKIREKLSKSYMQVIFIASISAIVGIGALLIMTRMYNHALTNYGFSQGDIGKAMTVFTGAQSDLRGAIGYDEESIIKELKEDYYVKQDSFNTYLAEVEKSMVTKAGRDAYNQILADLDGYWDLSDELIEIGATTDEASSKEAQNRANKELKPLYEVVYNDLKNLMDINIQKGDQLEAIPGSDGDYCCDRYDRSDNSFHFDWQKIWKSDLRWNRKPVAPDVRTPENICGRRS